MREVATRWRMPLERVELLSDRERQAFRLLGDGFSNRLIADRLHVTERTAKAHVTAILTKLEVESRLQIGLVAQAHQLVYESTLSQDDHMIDT